MGSVLGDRKTLMQKTNIGRKIERILENKEEFINKINKELDAISKKETTAKESDDKDKGDANSDMIVCVRIRPRSEVEMEQEYFSIAHNSTSSEIVVHEPSFDVRGRIRVSRSGYSVDHVFGPEEENSAVYTRLGTDVVDLALQGGICSMLSYGQTGAGKTFTMDGMIHFLANDLFDRQALCKGKINIHFSCFEILGDHLRDLQGEDENVKLELLEDKFGKAIVKGAVEKQVESAAHVKELFSNAGGHRKTVSTFKNDTSSRSHAVYRFRIENEEFKSAEDGCLFVIDLAGSENSSDSQFHDKERIKETRCINTSLMALKECIINRAKASVNSQQHFHIPFRNSKLTLLLKEAFELECHKICKTIIFANVSPTLVDSSMTLNTLRYVAPIKEGMNNRMKVEPNPNNPMFWSNERLVQWFQEYTKGMVNTDIMCPFESGRQILRIPEVQFLDRLVASNTRITQKKAKAIYDKLWSLLIDARVAARKEKAKNRNILQSDKVYGVTADKVPERRSIFQEIIEDDLKFKGISPVVLLTRYLRLLEKSCDVTETEQQIADYFSPIKDCLSQVDTVQLSGKVYTKTDAGDNFWEGIWVPDQDGATAGKTSGSVLLVHKLQDLWFIAGSQKQSLSSLKALSAGPLDKLVKAVKGC